MEEEKKENNEKNRNRGLEAVFKVGRAQGDHLFVTALLVKRIDKLTNSIKESLKNSDELTKITNKLTEKIKSLNWILIILGTIGLIMAGFSLYMQYFRN